MAPPEATYNVILVGASRIGGGEQEASSLLAERFRLSPEVSLALVRSLPTEVKRGLSEGRAQRYANALTQLGFDVRVTQPSVDAERSQPDVGSAPEVVRPAPSEAQFDRDLEEFVARTPAPGLGSDFELPGQLTGKHSAVPAATPGKAEARPSFSQALGLSAQPAVHDELAAIDDDDALELAAGLDSQFGQPAITSSTPPASPQAVSTTHTQVMTGLEGLIQRGGPDAAEAARAPDEKADSGFGLEAPDPSDTSDAPALLSSDLEDQLQTLTASYRAIESDPRGAEVVEDSGEGAELELARPPSGASIALPPMRATTSARRRAVAASGDGQSLEEGMYIQNTGSFTPARRTRPWGMILGVPLLLGALSAGGFYGYEAYIESLPESRYAVATHAYEVQESRGDVTTTTACASSNDGSAVCRFDRWFYAATFPDAPRSLHQAAAAQCYGEVEWTGSQRALQLDCSITLEEGVGASPHRLALSLVRDCSADLGALEVGQRAVCTESWNAHHTVDDVPVFVGSDEQSTHWEKRRDYPVETVGGVLETTEFVVELPSGQTQRAFWWEPGGVVVRRRGFSGERLADLTYRRDPSGSVGEARIADR